MIPASHGPAAYRKLLGRYVQQRPSSFKQYGEAAMPKPTDFSLEWNAPKAGDYNARVTDIEIFSGDTISLRISYETQSEPRYGLFEYVRIDAPTHHPRYAEVGPGRARIVQLAEAAGIDPKTINSIDALPDLLTGVRAKIRVDLQIKDGVQVPVVRTVLGPAGPEPQADGPPDNAE